MQLLQAVFAVYIVVAALAKLFRAKPRDKLISSAITSKAVGVQKEELETPSGLVVMDTSD
jgi:hypothetical protein